MHILMPWDIVDTAINPELAIDKRTVSGKSAELAFSAPHVEILVVKI